MVAIVLAVRYLRVAENRPRWSGAWTRSRPCARCSRSAPPAPAGPLRLGPADSRRPRARVHQPDGRLAVAVFVLIAYISIVSGDPGPTPGDRPAIDLAAELNRLADRDRQGGHRPRLVAGDDRGRPGRRRGARRPAALGGGLVLVVAMMILHIAVPMLKEALDRPRPPDGLVDANGDGLSQRPRRLLGDLRLARADGRGPGPARAHPRERSGPDRGPAHRRDRAQPRLPRRPLPQRRQRRLGARRLRRSPVAPRSRWSSPIYGRISAGGAIPEGDPDLVDGQIGTEYFLFGGAALISLVAFAALILVPAIGSFGRGWEKATAVASSRLSCSWR